MDAARREKKEHGTLAFPFQIYPALDAASPMTATLSHTTGILNLRLSQWMPGMYR